MATKTSVDLKGKKVLIRTVTYFFTGLVKSMDKDWIVLDKAAWVADTGRFTQAVKTGEFSEVEMYAQPVMVSRGAVVDITTIPVLPTEQK